MIQEGLEDQQEFNKKIGIQRAITRWKTIETTPGLKSCLAIKRAFGRSLDWIIFGEEPARQVEEAVRKFYDVRPLPGHNEPLLIQVVATIEETILRLKLKTSPMHKGRLVSTIYDICQKDKIRPDSHLVEKNWDLCR